jgi:hypothetical protein
MFKIFDWLGYKIYIKRKQRIPCLDLNLNTTCLYKKRLPKKRLTIFPFTKKNPTILSPIKSPIK